MDVASPDRSANPKETPEPKSASNAHGWRQSIDVGIAAALIVFAAIATAVFPDGSLVRMLVVFTALLTAPGYLLIQASLVPARSTRTRFRHLLVSVGVSPAVVALFALSAAILPGGFRPLPIIVFVTAGSLALAGVALLRRWAAQPATVASEDEDVTQTA